MVQSIDRLLGSTIAAADGDIGTVDDVLFDERINADVPAFEQALRADGVAY